MMNVADLLLSLAGERLSMCHLAQVEPGRGLRAGVAWHVH